ncbi:MAG: hypothetical protein ACE5GZ_03775 [Gammaproteobacteria bacterium]
MSATSLADEKASDQPQAEAVKEGMNNEKLQEIIQRIDPEFTGRLGYWQIRVANIGIRIITDQRADRMRIIIPIRKAEEMEPKELYRILQANFDTALDARYAIGKGILWSTFIHPLSSLSSDDFLSGLGQTINIVTTYGKTYSSGALTFGGGDSKDLIQKKLIEELKKKGQVI